MKSPSNLINLIKIARDSGVAGLGELFYIVAVYALNWIISRFLGAEGVGIYAQATALVLFASLLTRSGFEGGVLRFVSSYLAKRDYARLDGITFFATRLIFLTGLFWSIILFAGASVLANQVWHEPQLGFVVRMFALTVPFSALTTIWLSTVQALRRVEYRVYLERVFIPLGTLALVALFLLLGWRWWGVTIGTLSVVLLGTWGAYYIYHHLRKSLATVEKEKPKLEIKEWFGFCSPLLFSGILAFIIARMATLLLGYFRSSFEVGIFDVATKVAFMVELPLAVSNIVFAPLIGEMYAQGDLDQLQTLFKIVTKWVFTASLLIFLMAGFLAKPVLEIFGSEFTEGIPVLFILGFCQLINAGTGAVGWILIMSGHSMLHLFNSVLSALLTIVLGFLLMPSHGMIGAAVTVGSVFILVNLVRLTEVFYLLRIHPYRQDFVKPIIAGLLTFGLVYLLQGYLIASLPPMFWMHAITLGAIVVLYIAILILLRLRPEEKELLSWAFQKMGVS